MSVFSKNKNGDDLAKPITYEDGDRNQLALLINELGLVEFLNANIPVNIENIAKVLGASSVRKSDIPAAGMLLPSGDKFKVLVNGKDIQTRQRFSCAHEIAHVIFDPKFGPAMRQSSLSSNDRLERNCEDLAALLLMPDPAFSNYVDSYDSSIQTVEKLAQIFLTSIQATTLRFVNVIKEPCVAIFSEMKEGTSGYKLRVRWSRQNIQKANGKPQYFIPCGKSIEHKTAQIAYQTGHFQSDVEGINMGDLRLKAYSESKRFQYGDSRYLLTLVFPDREIVF